MRIQAVRFHQLSYPIVNLPLNQTELERSYFILSEREMAFDPALLERTWTEVKEVVGKPSSIDPLTKEMIYIAVSVTNNCTYCVHSHTAAARAKGMTQEQYGELLAIIGLAGKTNQLATALQVPVDDAFDASRRNR